MTSHPTKPAGVSPPRRMRILAESAGVKAGRFASLDTGGHGQGMAAMRRTGGKQASFQRGSIQPESVGMGPAAARCRSSQSITPVLPTARILAGGGAGIRSGSSVMVKAVIAVTDNRLVAFQAPRPGTHLAPAVIALSRAVAMTVRLTSADMKRSLICRGIRAELPLPGGPVLHLCEAGPLTAVSQTCGTAPDSGVLTGHPMDPGLRKRPGSDGPDTPH